MHMRGEGVEQRTGGEEGQQCRQAAALACGRRRRGTVMAWAQAPAWRGSERGAAAAQGTSNGGG